MSRCHHTFEILRDIAGNPSLLECPACGAWWDVNPNPQNMAKGPCAICGSECTPGESLCVDCLTDEAQDASPAGSSAAGHSEGAVVGALAPSLPSLGGRG